MTLELTKEECATLVAALKAWIDPIGYMISENGMLSKFAPLRLQEARGLLIRLASTLGYTLK